MSKGTLALEPEGITANGKRWITGIAIGLIWISPLFWMDTTTFIVLTVAGLAMGMIFFLIASGLTLIFGLMDVLNMAHGAFFAWGAYAGFSLLDIFDHFGWVETGTFLQCITTVLVILLVAFLVGALLGIILERVIIRQVYGDHLRQILITMGASFVMVELIKIFWGLNDEVVAVPLAFRGSFDVMDVIVNKFRILAIILGIIVFGAIQLVLKKTKLGIIVRAGVENKEIVEATGYNINRIFTGVFCAGVGLAAMGGVMMAMFKQEVHPAMGEDSFFFALMVVIIGGMGSVGGSFLGALMLGLSFNYVAFLVPKLALGVNILIMAATLLIRPTGLFGHEE
jgi:branched-chain amino acid transport system permease protein